MNIIDGTTSSEVKEFGVESGALRVTDPCYSLDVWCSGQLDNVKNGRWNAFIGYYKDPDDEARTQMWLDGLKKQVDDAPDALKGFYQVELDRRKAECDGYKGRPAFIRIIHKDHWGSVFSDKDYQKVDIHVGVDSGQAGFFDLVKYTEALSDKNDNRDEDQPKFNIFYDSVGRHTLGDDGWGVIEFGAVSLSGYGDGGYDCYAVRDAQGQVIAATIVFIGDYDEEEGDEDGDDETVQDQE